MAAADPGPFIVVQAGAATDRGLRRAINEDSFLAQTPTFVVADGMGGHEAGEVASAAVVAEFAAWEGRTTLAVDEVRDTVRRARDRVTALAGGTAAGAGTTLSGVVVADVDGVGYWLVVNIGDSRTYRLQGGILEQISVDHSVVQELVDSGELVPAEAAVDSRRHVITRAIGAGSAADADYWLIPAEEGDRLLICSDGLSGEVDDARLAEVLRAEAHPQQAARRLVQEALHHGGRDNVTAVVVDALRVGTDDGGRTQPQGEDAAEADADTHPRSAQTAGRTP